MSRFLKKSIYLSFALSVIVRTPLWAEDNTLEEKVHADFQAGHSAEAVALLQQEAARNNPEAQYGLGVLYDKGSETAKISQDPAQAFHWYTLAAQNGHAPSQNN